MRGQAHYYHCDSIIIITSSDLAAQVEATAVDWRLLITIMVVTFSDFPESYDLSKLLTGMDMESWRSDKYSNGRYKVRIL